jgi:hypothetical protein
MDAKTRTKIEISTMMLLISSLGLGACTGAGDDVGVVQSAVDQCVFGAPVVTQTTEETPGPVAPGISKVYFVTVQNTNSSACGPATLNFVPDSFHLFSIVAQPSSAGGVASGATTQFRVTVTSDPSVAVGSYAIGFTVVSLPGGTSVRGSLTYVATLDNPTGCNRQRVAIAIDNAQPPPLPPSVPNPVVTYHVTARNIDNPQCGSDTFHLSPCSLHFFSVLTDGPFTIAPQGSATFTLTIQAADFFGSGTDVTECFDVFGDHHVTPDLRTTGNVRYRLQ